MYKRIVKVGILLLILTVMVIWYLLTQPFVISKNRIGNLNGSSARLKQYVTMLSETLPSRYSGYELDQKKAEFIYERMSQYTRRVRYQRFTVDGREYRNVLGSIGADRPDCSIIVMGAHYDTYSGYSGADDNSSGVAGMLEIMRQLAHVEMRCPVEFVAYALEEPPYFNTDNMGSYVHAKSLIDRGLTLGLMVSIEMIGYFDDAPGSQTYPYDWMKYLYSDRADFIAVVGNMSNMSAVRKVKKYMRSQMRMPVYSINVPASVVEVDFSDHMSYWRLGMPAVMVTDTAFYRNGYYHTSKDTAETLDYQRMADVVNGLSAVAIYYQALNP